MNSNEKSSEPQTPKIKIEPNLASTSPPTNKITNATPVMKKKTQSDALSSSNASENANIMQSIKIKTEPGIVSASSSASGSSRVPKVKIEPGLSPTPHPSRLTSFRPARDLTLTGNMKPDKVNKRVFTPNLNVQRNKKKEDGTTVKSEVGSSRSNNRGRGRGQNDRGRGRGRGNSNVTQSTGVFSEGISEISKSARRSSGMRYGTSSYDRKERNQLEKPKLNLNVSVDKADEQQKLKLLLKDDFIDDGDDDINTDNTPISLPLIKQLKIYNNETEGLSVGKKEEKEQDMNIKPIVLKDGKAIMSKQENIKKSSSDTINVSDVIQNESNGYIILRFPDCLPGLKSNDDTHDQSNHRNYNEKKPPDNSTENKNKTDYCTLRSLKAGYLGKLQIHQSGKARLLLGDNSLVVDMGSRLGFRQDVVAAKVDGLNKELVNLGRITSTLICTPDFESILANI